MSQASKQSIFILFFLLIGSLFFTAYLAYEKEKIKDEKIFLEQQLSDSQTLAQKRLLEIDEIAAQLKTIKTEKAQVEEKLAAAEAQAESMVSQLQEVSNARDEWQTKVEQIAVDRDKLLTKIEELKKQTIEPSVPTIVRVHEEVKEEAKEEPNQEGQDDAFKLPPLEEQTDTYWAGVLREKANLQIEVNTLKESVSAGALEIAELNQKNTELQIKIDNFKTKNVDVERMIKHKEDLISNLSLELARAKNENNFSANRVMKIKEENDEIRRQIKELVATKTALEKSTARLTEDRNAIKRKLVETEGVIQNKIDEIWEIKDSLEKTFKANRTEVAAGEVELPPIVVSARGPEVIFDSDEATPGYNGSVVSVNEENNFVIVDIGQNTGIALGEKLSVYRNDKYIAALEVIQVRKDICAADIKDQWSKVKAGDVVR